MPDVRSSAPSPAAPALSGGAAGCVGARLVGVDYGVRRVGLALADPLRMFAQPLGAFSPDEALEKLRALHAAEGIEAVVVGWPLTEGGAEGEAVARVRPYVRRLERALRGARIVPLDERYSSARAAEALHAAGSTRKARRDKGRVDAAAAALILQDYLEEVRTGQ